MTDTQQSWQQSLNVWIERFRDAQAKVRELQDELDKVTASGDVLLRRYEDALKRLSVEELAAHHAAVAASPRLLPVVAPDASPCGGACGCR